MFTVIVRDVETGKIQTTNAVENNVIKNHEENGNLLPAYQYDFEKSIGYIDKSYLTYANQVNNSLQHLEGRIAIDNYELTDDSLYISGTGIIENVVFDDGSQVRQTIILEDYNGYSKEYPCEITGKTYNINDGNNYINAGFEVSIPLSDLNDSYIVKLKTQYFNYYTINNLRSSNKKYSNQTKWVDGTYYQLFTSQLYNYRFEINVFNMNKDYSIYKPSARQSLLSFDRINLNEGTISIDGQAMIYYLDYSQPVQMQMFMKDEDGNIYNLDTQSLKCEIDYSQILNIEENSDYICFNASGDVPQGYYSLYMTIENDGYTDTVELTNRTRRQLPSNGIVTVYTDEIRNRIMTRR